MRLAEGYAKVDAVKLRKQRSGAADLEIALSEGKNREIRRILARLGHKVVALKRLAIGPLKLGQLPAGGWRPLTKFEIQALYAAALTGRRKKRGTGKPLRGKPRAGAADESGEPAMAAGQFDRYGDDDFDDNYGPSLDETSDEGDEEYIVVGDASPKGSVIPYDDDDVEDDGGSMMFDDEDADDDADDDADEEAPVRRGRPAARGSKPTGSSSRSPNDLRSRKRASGGEGQSSRTGYKAGYKSSGYKGSKGPRSASAAVLVVALAARRSLTLAPAVGPPMGLVKAAIQDPMLVVKDVHRVDQPVDQLVDQLVVVRLEDRQVDQQVADLANQHHAKVDLADRDQGDRDQVVVPVEPRVDQEAARVEADHRAAKVDRANVAPVDPVEANDKVV